jgi:hypothetical protein
MKEKLGYKRKLIPSSLKIWIRRIHQFTGALYEPKGTVYEPKGTGQKSKDQRFCSLCRDGDRRALPFQPWPHAFWICHGRKRTSTPLGFCCPK